MASAPDLQASAAQDALQQPAWQQREQPVLRQEWQQRQALPASRVRPQAEKAC